MPDLTRPSRDGDQFHYLWAARRCLSLLALHGDLVAVAIEGASPHELPFESASLPAEEVIDIVEYYGDDELSNAPLVRYMQLKHSSRHAARSWTASGLKKTLVGFSARYRELVRLLGEHDVADRFEFWFVTNRPISAAFLDAVSRVAQDTGSRRPADHEKLVRCTGLHGSELSSFCRLLRFEPRQDDYWEQRNILFREVSDYLPDYDADAPTQLKEIVTRKALSESASDPRITKMDVMRALKTDEGRLFPARSLIETIEKPVPREQEAELVRMIVEAEKRPVLVHAMSGVGKSVVLHAYRWAPAAGFGVDTVRLLREGSISERYGVPTSPSRSARPNRQRTGRKTSVSSLDPNGERRRSSLRSRFLESPSASHHIHPPCRARRSSLHRS